MIVVDSREPEYVAALLVEMGVEVIRRAITPGDYVLSSECAVERKTVRDFVNSVYSGRVFEQVESLRRAYSRPILILEGDIEEELEMRSNPRAIWGALLRLQADMGVPVLNTPTVLHTADLLYTLSKRLQRKKEEKISVQHKPRLTTDREKQMFVIASLPNIGEELAARLLRHFGSIRNVFRASKEDLEKVEGIGGVKAERIIKLLDLMCHDSL